MPTIEVITGNESWQNHSAKFNIFFVDHETFVETPLWSYSRLFPSVVQQLNRTTIQARPGMKPELGMWYRANYTMPDRAIMKVYGQRHAGQGSPDTKGMFFIRLRANAAHRRYSMALSRGTEGALPSAYIDGRFDVLTLRDLEGLEIEIQPVYKKFYEENHLRHFSETINSPEVAANPIVRRVRVRDEKGQEVTFVRTKRIRRLDL